MGQLPAPIAPRRSTCPDESSLRRPLRLPQDLQVDQRAEFLVLLPDLGEQLIDGGVIHLGVDVPRKFDVASWACRYFGREDPEHQVDDLVQISLAALSVARV
jgi:hypothetical protein